MNTINNRTEGGAQCRGLLSLFGRKIKCGTEADAGTEAASPQPSLQPGLAAFGHGRRILIADDDPVFTKATENKLKSHGFTVATASEGSAVLQAAREEAPDAILLDIEFPAELPTSWDGITILEWLNTMNWSPSTPIIICTGRQDPELERRAKTMRAAAVLHKPLDYSELLGLIESSLANNQPARTDVTASN